MRKHRHHFAPLPDGTIESGVGHCDSALSPYGPPDADLARQVTARSLELAGQRAQARERWRVGEAYEGVETAVLRVRAGRDLGAPAQLVPVGQLVVPGAAPLTGRVGGVPRLVAGLSAASVVATDLALSLGGPVPLGVVTGVGVVGSAVVLGRRLVQSVRALDRAAPSGALEQLAWAVADALRETGDTGVGADGVRLAVTADGWSQASLVGVTVEQSRLFTDALDEVLAPLAEPRALVSRVVLARPATARGRLALAARRTAGRPVVAAESWHAVPAALGRNRRRREVFAAAWARHVGPGRLLLAEEPEAAGVLGLLRGADPFAVTSQTRVQWT